MTKFEVTIVYYMDDEGTANLTADEAWSNGADDVRVQEVEV